MAIFSSFLYQRARTLADSYGRGKYNYLKDERGNPLKTKDYQDFIDFANILKSFYGKPNGSSVNQGEFVGKLFENICNADIGIQISNDPGTLGAYLNKRSIYPNVSTVLLSTQNKGKFKRWIMRKSVTDDAIKTLLEELESFVNRCPRFEDNKHKLLKLCSLETAGDFAAAIFINILLTPDEARKKQTKYISEHSKKAVRQFVGRTAELDDVKKLLASNKPQMIWIHGMGGLGKTQLCRKLFYDLAGKFPFLGGISFDGSFKQSVVNQIVCEKNDSDLEHAYNNTIEFINSKGAGLVLFIDNVEGNGANIAELEKLNCHVIVTSRNAAPDIFTEKALGFLSLSECKKLFYNHYKRKKDDSVNEVIHRAGYLTLAVELLAKTAAAIDISTVELLGKLIEKSFDLKTVVETNWDNNEEAQNKAVADQFGIVFSFSGIKDDGEKIYVLKNMSVLPYLATRQKLLCEWLALDDESAIFRNLYDAGWLQYSGEDGYLMHPVISYTVKRELAPTFFECARLVSAFIDAIEFTELESVFEVLEFAPYAQELADYFRNESNYPAEMALLYIRLASVFRANGEYNLAWQYGTTAEYFIGTEENTDKNLVALVYNILADICTDMRNMNAAGIRYAELAVSAAEESDDPEPLLLSAAYHNLAGLLAQQGNDFDRAKKMAFKAIEIRQDLHFYGDIHLANTYRTLAFILRNSGDTGGSRKYMERCLHIMRGVYADKPNHPSLAITYNNYARILCEIKGQLDCAIDYYKKAITIRETNNPDDPRLALNHNNIASAYLQKGDYAIAVKHLSTSIDMDVKNRGDEHPDLAGTYYTMALAQFLSSDYSQAVVYAKKSMGIKTTARDELECRCLVARCYYEMGQKEIARQEIEDVIAFCNVNGIDPEKVDHYTECMEIYEDFVIK
ncbi:MAG TPA: hypothetical protein DEQ02_00370 [Ruminococcaceae bacterium]|nr:hypothetical protein [Oscillospiraceae bacterium]